MRPSDGIILYRKAQKEGSQDEVPNAQQAAALALNAQDAPPQNLQFENIVP